MKVNKYQMFYKICRPTIVRLGAQPNGGSAFLSVSALDRSVPLVIEAVDLKPLSDLGGK